MRSTPEIDVFDVRYTSYSGLRIAGWLCKPVGGGPFPGLVIVPGYVSEPQVPKQWAAMGYAAFGVAPRGKLRSNAEFNPGYPGLLMHNILDRENYAYRGFYMDAVRGFDLLSARADVDETRIGVHGSSQGGALTLLVAALRPEGIAAAAAGAPYLCSMMDAASLTSSYPYQEINDYLRINPDDEDSVRRTLDLYDIHHFVDRIRCPIIINVGLKDDVCPPETGFAMFKEIGSPSKQIYPYDGCAHDAGSAAGHATVVSEFLAHHLRSNDGAGGE
jgi:cephalosporin-C deacetylase